MTDINIALTCKEEYMLVYEHPPLVNVLIYIEKSIVIDEAD